ncbi:MAG TPA: heme o synthase [Terriglobales bacterium]|jgi:protoheme IX farnesyltransferase|nr:heme o synthase [Terriglobales bacterium]
MSSVTQPLAVARPGARALLENYAELVKLRVTSLIVMTAWCGFYLAAGKNGVTSLGWSLFHAMLGIGLVAGGTAALNEVLERDADARMRRTAQRPLPAKHMSVAHATAVGLAAILGGMVYLSLSTNLLTGVLALATSVTYLGVYTPLKKVSPVCTFIGAFPGAMPGVLGWTAVRGRLELEALVLFAIVFFWQFPHFHSIAWLYREDYENAAIRMLPVVDSDGRSTARSIVMHSVLLIPVTLAPTLLHMSGWIYLAGALLLGLAFLWTGVRLARLRMAPSQAASKQAARQVLVASVFYLPLLFALMMLNAA